MCSRPARYWPAAPAMVPPVATMTMCGLAAAGPAASITNPSAVPKSIALAPSQGATGAQELQVSRSTAAGSVSTGPSSRTPRGASSLASHLATTVVALRMLASARSRSGWIAIVVCAMGL